MAGVFQPPPTWALPVIVDEVTGRAIFNPVWLRWFVDFSANVGTGGAGSGNVISVNTKTGEVILIASDVGAPFLATTNHWPQMQYFDGNIDTLSFFFAGGPTGGIGPKVDNESVLGAVGFRWKNLETYLLGLVGNFTWNGYAIVPPDGTTVGFLRKDGTWATPAGTGAQLNVANTWTALQTFNLDITTPSCATNATFGFVPTVTDTYALGHTSYRWNNVITKNMTLGENLVWNALTIPKPAGSTTTFLRNDGTWATPAGGVSLSVANTWTAKQTFSGGLESDGYTFVAGAGGQLAPKTNIISSLGISALRWLKAWFQDLDITGTFKWGTTNVAAIPAPTGSTLTFLRNDGTWTTPGARRGGIRKTAHQNIGALGSTTPVSLKEFAALTFTTSVGVTTSLGSVTLPGTLAVTRSGDFNVIVNLAFLCDSDNNAGRVLIIRLVNNLTNAILPAGEALVFIGAYAGGATVSFTLPCTVSVTDPIRIDLIADTGSNFTGLLVVGATFAVTEII